MAPYFTFFILLFSSLTFTAQSVFNTTLIQKIAEGNVSENIRVFVQTKPGTSLDASSVPGITIHYKAGNISSVSASVGAIKELSKLPQVKRIEYTMHHLQLMGDTCVVRNRIKDIKTGALPLTQAYDGLGVLVGIIDSGTDFNHPDFKDAAGNSRIRYLWDMNKPVAANTPVTFGYGQEWTNTEIDLGQCTHDDLAHFGHGTASSGIAAGNGLAINHFEGMAPKADLMVVALDFNDPNHTIADAIQYLFTKAQQLNRPIVINASVGDYDGSHDGTDLEAQLIDQLITAMPGRVLVASAGNAGNVPFHVGYAVTPADTSFTWISGTGTITLDEYADTTQIKQVRYAIGVNNNSFTDLGRTTFKAYNNALNTLKRDTIYHNFNRIGIVETSSSINTFGVYELSIKIRADSANYLWRVEHTGTGRIDSWNFDYVNNGLPSSSVFPNIVHYKKADTLQTIVSSFQCSDEVITVANYVNRNQYTDVNSATQTTTEIPGDIAATSSIGPSRDLKVKPDITASGATILASAALGILPNLIANAPQVVAQGGYHITAGGTSASSPVVAGLAALYLQKHPTATNQQVKQAIINCAYSDAYTTSILPNNRWGYGKLDGFKTMTCGELTTGINLSADKDQPAVYPNPMIHETTVSFTDDGLKTIKLYNSAGQLVFRDTCHSDTYVLKRNGLSEGLYLLVCEEKIRIHKVKIVIL